MQAARKEEVFPMESDQTKIEGRLDRIEVDVAETKGKVGKLETSVAKLETSVGKLQADVKDLQSDVKELRTRMEDGFQSVRKEIHDAKIWALLIAAAMLGVLARGFHWI